MSPPSRREITYCAECRGRATQRVEKIFGQGKGFGLTAQWGLCDEHAAELVRTTRDRYVITPLPRPGKRKKNKREGQEQWEFPESSGGGRTFSE